MATIEEIHATYENIMKRMDYTDLIKSAIVDMGSGDLFGDLKTPEQRDGALILLKWIECYIKPCQSE